MTRYIGTTAMGIRAPIIKAGDNLIDIDSVSLCLLYANILMG